MDEKKPKRRKGRLKPRSKRVRRTRKELKRRPKRARRTKEQLKRRPPKRTKRARGKARLIAFAPEPPRNANLADLLPAFAERLQAALTALAAAGTPFRFHEGFRTLQRQRWLYDEGRTRIDGVRKISNHQGDGRPGSARAADCYPVLPNGKLHEPPAEDPVWDRYAEAVSAAGLRAGRYFKRPDSPHCELPA